MSHPVVMLVPMATRQLHLISSDPSSDVIWKLDERTKALGREGVARARRALSGPADSPAQADQRSAA